MRDGVMRDGVMRDGVMRDGVMRDGLMRDGLMRESLAFWLQCSCASRITPQSKLWTPITHQTAKQALDSYQPSGSKASFGLLLAIRQQSKLWTPISHQAAKQALDSY